MKKELSKRALSCCVLLAAASLAACGTPPAKDFGGRWKPVNHFQDAPSEIPLNQAYTYYAAPMDETLRTMLRRWTKDAGLQFSYQLQSDYTLYKAVTQIHTTDVYSATSELSSIYAAQGVSVTTDGHEIRVSAARMSSSTGTTETPASGTPQSASAPQNTPPAQAK
ncbi:Toxin co-regulated pilus biosynthesis protein Q [Dyella jiangningensis]|uniref:hypothetical protein n=1 Tax=Dyella sp. AtDHG13 TaxID=1938897 RepID=UPI0008812791|nr:hypothetical protein [Dyella sp. AtDHG13]PXV59819.1 toxin co-regulated pilus biosynthesis protein Q [Dyella sp. AtDHG13]SDJ21350.1 Toxin co-regulated pilus biosynthesis protein Q [Dyella jiangningensis]